MSNTTFDDEFDDDEDWYDDDDQPDEEEAAHCPECSGPIHIVADKCPNCGYWLTESDRRAMWSGLEKPKWVKITAMVVLAVMILGLFGIGAAFF